MLDTRNAPGRRSEHASPRLRSDVLNRYTSDRTLRSLSRFGSLAGGFRRLQILCSGADAYFGSHSWTPPNCIGSGHVTTSTLGATQNSGQYVYTLADFTPFVRRHVGQFSINTPWRSFAYRRRWRSFKKLAEAKDGGSGLTRCGADVASSSKVAFIPAHSFTPTKKFSPLFIGRPFIP